MRFLRNKTLKGYDSIRHQAKLRFEKGGHGEEAVW